MTIDARLYIVAFFQVRKGFALIVVVAYTAAVFVKVRRFFGVFFGMLFVAELDDTLCVFVRRFIQLNDILVLSSSVKACHHK